MTSRVVYSNTVSNKRRKIQGYGYAWCVLCYVLLYALVLPARAQETPNTVVDPLVINLQQEVTRVRQQMAALRSALSGESQDRRQLEGRIETTEFRFNALEQRLDDLVSSLDGRLADVESSIAQLVRASSVAQTSVPTLGGDPTLADIITGSRDQAQMPSAVNKTQAPATNIITNATTQERVNQQSQVLGLPTQNLDDNAGGAPAEVAAAGVAAAGVDSQSVEQPLTLEQQYQQALTLIQQQQYAPARVRLQSLWNQHKDHALASNLLYWIGETYYIERAYEQAVRHFALSVRDYPEGDKAQASLLKLGTALGLLGRDQDACRMLGQMNTDQLDAEMTLLRDNSLAQYACS